MTCYLFNFFIIKIKVNKEKKKNSKPRLAPKLTDSHACAFLIKVKRVGPSSAASLRFFLGILVFYSILSFDFLFLIFFCWLCFLNFIIQCLIYFRLVFMISFVVFFMELSQFQINILSFCWCLILQVFIFIVIFSVFQVTFKHIKSIKLH